MEASFLAAYQVYLYRCTGATDFLVIHAAISTGGKNVDAGCLRATMKEDDSLAGDDMSAYSEKEGMHLCFDCICCS